jgi:hypothetical protein
MSECHDSKERAMPANTSIPIEIRSEAAERVGELGMREQLDRMLDHTCQSMAGLRSLEVQLSPVYDPGDEPTIVIQATVEGTGPGDDARERLWGQWKVETFSPDISRHFVLLTVYEESHGR